MSVKTVDATTLKSWLDTGEAVLIDVREPGEYSAEHISQAHPVPLGAVCKTAMPSHSGKKLVIHCKAGRRGGMACEKLLKEAPDLDIYNLDGGMDAWMQAGLPIQSSGKFFLPLDRQVQLTIGIGILSGIVLGYTVHSHFFLFSGFFGLGLTFAGATGWCGLALLMAKMPWNRNTNCKGTCHG